ncbi:MAG: PQQ-binding-like beta-propeller repeat protein [Limisphaerales bacterium]
MDSNFLVVEDRVLFVQADGSLTALRLEDGKVLARMKDRYYSGKLLLSEGGILVINYGTIFCLDPKTLAIQWDTPFHYEANVTSDRLVSYDGNGSVQARNLHNGNVAWTYDLPGALHVIVESNHVLVHRAATFEETTLPTTVLLDLETGKELFRKSPSTNEHWPTVFFDGANIFLMKASFTKKRSDFELKEMVIWNLKGEQIDTLVLPEKREQLRYRSSPFESGGRTFWNGRVYPDRHALDTERKGISKWEPSSEDGRFSKSRYQLKEGITVSEIPNAGKPGLFEFEIQSATRSWKGTLPYLADEGRISALYATADKVLIGSNLGHVECVDVQTGRSRWLYIFPTMRRTMSYSSRGLPPMMSVAAKAFQRENSKPPPNGFSLYDETNSSTQIIHDPDPVTPFQKLPLYLTLAWTGVLFTLGGLIWLHGYRRGRDPMSAGITTGLLLFVPLVCWFLFGRVSPGSAIGLFVTMILCLTGGLIHAIRSLRAGKRLDGTVLLILFVGVAILFLPSILPLLLSFRN